MNLFTQLRWSLSCPFENNFVQVEGGAAAMSISHPSFQPISTVLSKNNQPPLADLSVPGYQVQFYTSIHAIPRVWDKATHPDNVFLQRDYLGALENNPPENMRFCYLVFYRKNRPVGAAIGQLVTFNTSDNINEEVEEEHHSVLGTVKDKFKKFIGRQFDFNVLICGNQLLTGEHGFYFKKSKVKAKMGFKLLEEGLEYAATQLAAQGQKVSGFMLKDYPEEVRPHLEELKNGPSKYAELTFQPNMIMNIRPDWNSFEDYMAAMLSKYRVRVKRAFKKGAAIQKINFEAEDIIANKQKLDKLYEKVADNADFNMTRLHPNYFLALKQTFPDTFKLTAYYVNEELIAFYTTLQNGHELEAHFLGFDYETNREYQTYLNILYDIVRHAIETNTKQIIFARTALEIKSSVGAVPQEMYTYIRHKNSFPNRFVSRLVKTFEPKVEWTQRHPFK